MGLGHPGKKPWEKRKKGNFGPYNDSNPHNPSHFTDQNTNFNQSSITFEDIDKAVYMNFNDRFRILERDQPLIVGDAEAASMVNMNFDQFDQEKGFLRWPFLMYTRTNSKKKFRTNSGYKRIHYAVPIKKAQGIVIEEYITEPPINWELTYEFTFVTYFREAVNQLEEQLNFYFRNKRNIIDHEGERFSIGPENKDEICKVEMVNRDQAGQTSMYIVTFNLILECWTRDMSTMQKRERPNSYTIDFKMRTENGNGNTGKVYNIGKDVITNHTEPDEPIDMS